MRIVVLGGTFDPVHRGHIETAKDAARTLGASFGVLAVGDSHPHRPIPSLERDARVALVRLACTREPDIVEAGQLGADGTDLITVARQLSTTANELHFVFGADHRQGFADWLQRSGLGRSGSIWMVPRGDHPIIPSGHATTLFTCIRRESSSEVRRRLRAGEPIEHLVPDGLAEEIGQRYSHITPALRGDRHVESIR